MNFKRLFHKHVAMCPVSVEPLLREIQQLESFITLSTRLAEKGDRFAYTALISESTLPGTSTTLDMIHALQNEISDTLKFPNAVHIYPNIAVNKDIWGDCNHSYSKFPLLENNNLSIYIFIPKDKTFASTPPHSHYVEQVVSMTSKGLYEVSVNLRKNDDYLKVTSVSSLSENQKSGDMGLTNHIVIWSKTPLQDADITKHIERLNAENEGKYLPIKLR